MKELTIYKILASSFLIYVLWNYMIYFAIEYNWKSFMNTHWAINGFMIMIASSIWIATFFTNEEKKLSNQQKIFQNECACGRYK